MKPYVSDPDFTGCEPWSGYIGRDGYGRVNRGRRPVLAHRDAWERQHGEIPLGLELHHICGNRACVNLDHLALVTARGHKLVEQRERTHCWRGHAYAEHGRVHKGTTRRFCRACERENERRRSAAVRG